MKMVSIQKKQPMVIQLLPKELYQINTYSKKALLKTMTTIHP